MMIMTTMARLERSFFFFFPSPFFLLNADQGDWESARVSLVDGMTIRLMRNDVVGEEEQWELFLRIAILKL